MLRSASKGKKGQPTCRDAGSAAAGPLLCSISCRGGNGTRELSPQPRNSQSKRLMVGPGKLAPNKKLEAKPKTIYLFGLKTGQVILPSVTWHFFKKHKTLNAGSRCISSLGKVSISLGKQKI